MAAGDIKKVDRRKLHGTHLAEVHMKEVLDVLDTLVDDNNTRVLQELVKTVCRAKTTGALPAATYIAPPSDGTRNGRLVANANGALAAQDGVTLVKNDLLLVDSQADGKQNGPCKIVDAGGAAAKWELERIDEFVTGMKVKNVRIWVSEGTAPNADKGFVVTNNAGSDVVDTDALTFVQYTGLSLISAGAGLTKAGDTLDVGAGAGISVSADAVAVLGYTNTTAAVGASQKFLEATNNGVNTASVKAANLLTADRVFNLPDVADGDLVISTTALGGDLSGTVGAATIINGAVTTAKIGALAVDSTKIANDAVLDSKLADVASQTIKGRSTAGNGDPENLTSAQARTVLEDNKRNLVFADSPYTAVIADYLLLANTAGGAITINLPAVATSAGRRLKIKKTNAEANNVTIDGAGAETIDGAATQVLAAQWASVDIHCDGTAWFIF